MTDDVYVRMLRPVDDDSSAVLGPPPVQLKAIAEQDADDAYRPCRGIAMGFFLGTLMWSIIIIAWLLI